MQLSPIRQSGDWLVLVRELCNQHGLHSYKKPYDQGPDGTDADWLLGEFWNGLSSFSKTKRNTIKAGVFSFRGYYREQDEQKK